MAAADKPALFLAQRKNGPTPGTTRQRPPSSPSKPTSWSTPAAPRTAPFAGATELNNLLDALDAALKPPPGFARPDARRARVPLLGRGRRVRSSPATSTATACSSSRSKSSPPCNPRPRPARTRHPVTQGATPCPSRSSSTPEPPTSSDGDAVPTPDRHQRLAVRLPRPEGDDQEALRQRRAARGRRPQPDRRHRQGQVRRLPARLVRDFFGSAMTGGPDPDRQRTSPTRCPAPARTPSPPPTGPRSA